MHIRESYSFSSATFTLLAGLGLLSGCAGATDASAGHELVDENVHEHSEELVVNTQGIPIPSRHQNVVKIGVCWSLSQELFDSYATEREWVRTAIRDSWEAVAWIDYSGWTDLCAEGDTRLRLTFNPEMQRAGGLSGGVISFKPGAKYNAFTVEQTARYTAVHEFGHHLGFYHTHGRFDWQTCDGIAKNTTADALVLGDLEADVSSVMSYCTSESFSRILATGSNLSESDIEGVQALYGADGRHVTFGSIYGIRNQNKRFLRLDSDNRGDLSESLAGQDEYQRIFQIKPAQGTSSSKTTVQYDDYVHLVYAANDDYLCANSQQEIWGYAGTNTTIINDECRWRVARTADLVGGNNVDINDPLRFRKAPTSGSSSYHLTLESEDDWRMLGPVEER